MVAVSKSSFRMNHITTQQSWGQVDIGTHRTESGRNRAFMGDQQHSCPRPIKHVNLPMPSLVSSIPDTASHLERSAAKNDYFPVNNLFYLSNIFIIILFPQFHFNPAQSILVMEGEDLENMNAAVRKVSYINSRQFPTPGIRRLHISTAVQYVTRFFSFSSSSFFQVFLLYSFSNFLFPYICLVKSSPVVSVPPLSDMRSVNPTRHSVTC